MTTPRTRAEVHLSHRAGWLRAAVLGANDGIVSTASLVLGVAASGASGAAIVTAGIAGLAAGAPSMGARGKVSGRPQRGAGQGRLGPQPPGAPRDPPPGLPQAPGELQRAPAGELHELADIYEHRGLPPALATEVALTLSRHDALQAHARDELGLDEARLARPFQAAWASALAFSAGAALPLLAVALAPERERAGVVVGLTLIALALLGDVGARLGGAPRRRASVRVVVWGAIAMGVTAGIGALVGIIA